MSYFASIDRMEMIKKESTEEYPTGYTSSALPFYPDLDDKKLERFCADIAEPAPVVTVMKDGKSTKRTIEEATLLGGDATKKARRPCEG